MDSLWTSSLTLWTAGLLMFVAGSSVDEESTLQTTLLTNYNRNVRPSDTVKISLGLSLYNVLEMDIVDQHMVVSGALMVTWKDERLKWNSKDYNTTELFFRADEIWRPLLVLVNSADEIHAVGDNSNVRSIPLQVGSSGYVFWMAPVFFKSICTADVALFPFDTQTCKLVISSWMFPNDKVDFNLFSDNVFLNKYTENGEYKLVRASSDIEMYENYSNIPWSIAVFTFELQRRYSYYLINIVLPVLFLEALGVVVFLVPASSGGKLGYAVTLLLSLIVMTTIVASKMPTTSAQTPVLGIYVLEGVILAVLEVLMAVYVLQLHRLDREQRSPGKGHVILMSVLTMFSCRRKNKVSSIHTGDIEDQIRDVEKVIQVAEPPFHPDKKPLPAWESTEPLTYRDIAGSVEMFCFGFFSMLTVCFCLQALLTITCN